MDDWDLDTPAAESAPSAAPAPRPETAAPEAAPARRPRSRGVLPVRPQTLRQKVRSHLVWIAAALVVLLVGVFVGFLIARSQASDDAAVLAQTRLQLGELKNALSQSEDRNWTYYRSNEALQADLERARSGGQNSTSTTVPRPSGEGGTYGDGVYLVGEDISPGTYDGVVTGELGYWARLKGTDGSAAAIIANAIPGGPFVLTIYPADQAVELRGVEIRPR